MGEVTGGMLLAPSFLPLSLFLSTFASWMPRDPLPYPCTMFEPSHRPKEQQTRELWVETSETMRQKPHLFLLQINFLRYFEK